MYHHQAQIVNCGTRWKLWGVLGLSPHDIASPWWPRLQQWCRAVHLWWWRRNAHWAWAAADIWSREIKSELWEKKIHCHLGSVRIFFREINNFFQQRQTKLLKGYSKDIYKVPQCFVSNQFCSFNISIHHRLCKINFAITGISCILKYTTMENIYFN